MTDIEQSGMYISNTMRQSTAQKERRFVSVIIPTFNRVDSLKRTLNSLLNQSYPADCYEIIVSDNNSADTTRETVEVLAKRYPERIKYLREPRQGSHYARNSAAKHARGDILYYTDDDMIADKDLLREIIKPFGYDPMVASVTGRILPKWEIQPPDWILKYCVNGWLGLNEMQEDLVISGHSVGDFSGHQALKRDAFLRSGGYNPDIVAGEWVGDNENGLSIKLMKMGYKFAYVSTSIIYHLVPASRMTQQFLNRRLANQGNCDSYTAYRRDSGTGASLAGQMLSHRRHMFRRTLKFLVKRTINRDSWHLDRAYVDYYRNRLKYDRRLAKEEEWRRFVLRDDWLNEPPLNSGDL